MRIAYLDCFSGISGDMFLGALVDAGVPLSLLEQTTAALDLGARLQLSRVTRSGISATKIDVLDQDVPDNVDRNDAAHSPSPGHSHHQAHDHSHSHAHHHGRSLSEIKAIIARLSITSNARRIALSAFDALAVAEAKIHNTDIESVHFHEVGAVDAIVDIVCAAVGADALNVGRWICSPLNLGSGFVDCAHGRFPVPAPATLELLQSAPVYSSGAQVELVTPTGAALVRALATEFGPLPAMSPSATGYGAGSRDLPGAPNVLRITIGDTTENSTASNFAQTGEAELVTILEAAVDDLNPQVFGYVMERLLAEGALDVFAAPVHMKKNRPGMLITVLSRPTQANALARLLFAETSTIGVRMREEHRLVLDRRWVFAQTPWGKVRIKLASLNGTIANYAPEFEDCRLLAAGHHVPLKTVMQEALRAFLDAVAPLAGVDKVEAGKVEMKEIEIEEALPPQPGGRSKSHNGEAQKKQSSKKR